MEHDDTVHPTMDAEVVLTLLADEDAVLPDTDHCTVRVTDDVSRSLARGDRPEIVVLGESASAATVTDAIRRLRGSRTRSWLVCQGALPAAVRGSVTTVPARENPRRAVERTMYLALVERHRELAAREARTEASTTDAPATDAAAVEATRSAYAARLDGADFATLYECL